MSIPNLSAVEIEALEACHTPAEYRAVCDAIKSLREGAYPPDWWAVMKLTGRMDRILARWGETPDLKLRRENE